MESNLAKFTRNGSSYFIKRSIDWFCQELSLSVIKTNEPFSARISKEPRTVCQPVAANIGFEAEGCSA